MSEKAAIGGIGRLRPASSAITAGAPSGTVLQQRVVIEHVRPQIDRGRFAVKRIAGEQVEVTAAQAAHAIMHAENPLGMQIIVPRAIAPKEIHAIRGVPQVLGWRYFPGAHASRACGCPYCQSPGAIKSRRLREAFEAG